MSKLLSIVIPTYEMKGLGVAYLRQSFDILTTQTFTDFDIIVTDHSRDDQVENLCKEYEGKLTISYYRNSERIGNSSANLNNGIRKATGKLIKILFQDDFLRDEHSLENIVNSFDLEKDSWHITACEHTDDGKNFYRPFYPHYEENIHLGNNTISSPSVLTIKNENPLLFDERIIWLMDCDYYKRCHDTFGGPKILNTVCVVNRVGKHQVTNTLATESLRKSELAYMHDKFKKRKFPKISLDNVTLVAVSSVKIPETIQALSTSMDGIEFAETLLITHEKPEGLRPDITFVPCRRISSLDEYSRFMLFELAQHIKTDYALVVQHDGYVLRPYKWENEFLNYDYIGAPWPEGAHFTKDGTPVLVGNGGFSFRSKKLLNVFNELDLPFSDGDKGSFNEDGVICNYFRKEIEEAGVRFAPVEVASRFSLEDRSFSRKMEPFGFHRNKKFMPLSLYLKNLFS